MERTAPNATLSSAIHDPTFHRRHPPVFRRGRRCRTSRPRRSLVSRCEVRATVSSPTPPVVQVRTVPTGHVSITRDSRQFSFLRSWCTSLGSVRLSAPTHRVTYDRGRRIRKIRSVSSGSLEHATQRTEAQPGPIRTSPPAAPRRRDGCGTRGGGRRRRRASSTTHEPHVGRFCYRTRSVSCRRRRGRSFPPSAPVSDVGIARGGCSEEDGGIAIRRIYECAGGGFPVVS